MALEHSAQAALGLFGWKLPDARRQRCRVHFTAPFARIQVPPLPQLQLPWGAASVTLSQEAPKPTFADFSGTWIKDKHRSDSMDHALKLMKLGGLMRQAIKLIKGLQIKQDDKTFEMAVFSYIGWFKVVERYALSGAASQYKRRDFRRGRHTGRVSNGSSGDSASLALQLEWGPPLGGSGQDEFRLVGPDELHVASSIQVEGQTAQYTSVYRRKR